MKQKLESLKAQIESGKFPASYTHFAGSNLIITNDKEFKSGEDDIVICTPQSGPISWLVFQLKDIYKDHLNHSNKYDFYPEIGRILRTHFKQEGDLIDAMLHVVSELEETFQMDELKPIF